MDVCFFIIAALILQESYSILPVQNDFKLSVVDWTNYNYREPEGPGTYAFGYDIEDPETDNIQFRSEERHLNGTVIGSYGYLSPDGNVHIVHYIADRAGYRATVEDSRRGMLKPVQVLQESPSMSPQMTAALKSLGNYKHQKVHEDRSRPVDRLRDFPKTSDGSFRYRIPRKTRSNLNNFYYTRMNKNFV